jgi:hypothetical protein
MKTKSILIGNHFLGAIEPTIEDQSNGEILENEKLVWIGALERGEKMKSGIKILDPTKQEIECLLSECKQQLFFVSPGFVDSDEFSGFRNAYYGIKRLIKKLEQTLGEI